MTQAISLDRGAMELPRVFITAEPSLPYGFVAYVESKLAKNGSGGRPHIVKQLGSMDRTLEVLAKLWIEGRDLDDLSKELKVSYRTIWRFSQDVELYRNEIVEYFRYLEIAKPKDFKAFESVQNWRKQILLSGHRSALYHITAMKRICRGQIIHEFRCSNADKFDLEIAQRFIEMHITKFGVKPKKYQIMAMRHFLASKGIVIPRGFGAQYGLSGEKESYGKYAHIKLNDMQISQIKDFLRSKNEYVEKGFEIAFEIGVQTCSRALAIATIPISRMRQEGEYYVIEVFEPKVKEDDKHIGKTGKWWRKYPSKDLYEKIIVFAEKHKERELLFLNKATETERKYWLYGDQIEKKLNGKWKVLRISNGFTDALKEAYKQIGITEPYFYEHAIHTLRHIGAHRLLRLTNYNYEIVAKLGGWKDTKTLKDCYGEMLDNVIMGVISHLSLES